MWSTFQVQQYFVFSKSFWNETLLMQTLPIIKIKKDWWSQTRHAKRFHKGRRHLVHLANYLGPPSACTSDQWGHDLSPHLGQKAWTPSRRLSSWWRTGKTCRSAAPGETATAGWGRCLHNRWGEGEKACIKKQSYLHRGDTLLLV